MYTGADPIGAPNRLENTCTVAPGWRLLTCTAAPHSNRGLPTTGVGIEAGCGSTFTPAEGALQLVQSSCLAVMIAFAVRGGTGKSKVEAGADPVPRLTPFWNISTGEPGSRPVKRTLTPPAHNGGTMAGDGTGVDGPTVTGADGLLLISHPGIC